MTDDIIYMALYVKVSNSYAVTIGVTFIYEGLDVLIHNPRGEFPTDFFEIHMKECDQILRLNLTSAFLISRQAARTFRQKRHGAIVNISSVAGRSVSITSECHYTAAKSGILGLTRHMAQALARYNIRVNAVCPGLTNSERIVKRLEAQGKADQAKESIFLGRIGDVD